MYSWHVDLEVASKQHWRITVVPVEMHVLTFVAAVAAAAAA